MSIEPSVLLIDESEDSRQVLRTALERRGMRILEASHADDGLQMARQHEPNVIVLDIEGKYPPSEEVCDQLAEPSSGSTTSLVVLGSGPPSKASQRAGHDHRDRQFVAKPYHYKPLIRKIEELVA